MTRLPSRPLGVIVLVAVLASVACGSSDIGAVRIESTAAPPAAGEPAVQGSRPAPTEADQRPVVFIDPGHGGSDPGWGASYILPNVPPEKELTLDVALRTAAYLEEAGFRVVMSRTEDVDVNAEQLDLNGDGCIDPIDEIQARIDMANASGAKVLLSIHFNGMPGTQLSGSMTFYNAVREFSDQNERLAEMIQAAQLGVLESFGHTARDWGAIRDDSFDTPSQSECPTGYQFYTLIGPTAAGRPRPSMMPGVIVESMFLTYPREAELAMRADVRDSLAKAYADAIKEFLGDEHG